MYRSCIFCSAKLESNEVLERFPVGRTLAFDEAKGRLWAVCRRCARWNLAPLEERWEAIEDAERLFRNTRVRVHGENVGLARLPDGTRLIRVGQALPVEQAVWRYGRGLRRRRLHTRVVDIVHFGAPVIAGFALGPAVVAVYMAQGARRYREADRVAYRIAAEDSPTGQPVHLRWRDLPAARIVLGEDGTPRLEAWHWHGMPVESGGPVVLSGAAAAGLLGTALTRINRAGADDRRLGEAVRTIQAAGGPDMLLRGMSTAGWGLAVPQVELGEAMPAVSGALRAMGLKAPPPPLALTPMIIPLHINRPGALALEIALHEETERRAMEGELAMLERMWRDAEEIAAIADRLPDLPAADPPRLHAP